MESQNFILNENQCPLVSELKKLKKSSSEAVADEVSFSKFKNYMHIHRELEEDLISQIKVVNACNHKGLILVCGNVGDGKSHIISYIKHNYENLLNGFIIHNDATESRSRNRDEKQELSRVLYNFRDENLDNISNDKVIVAINLGVLSNFIDSEEGKKFSKLAEYVNKSGILTDSDVFDYSDNNGYFYHVNFGDYHIYRLTNGKAESPYIIDTINKIFMKSEENPFYLKYKECSKCSLNNCCPVKHNYEIMQLPNVIKGLVNIIIETIVKDKIILSTRDLLNFFYDIIVHSEFSKKDYIKSENKFLKYLEYCLPSLLYEHSDVSPLLCHMMKYDFVNQRTKEFDEITTKFNLTYNIEEMFREYISDNPIMNYILLEDINKICDISYKEGKKLRKKLFYCFARLCKLSAKENNFSVINQEFNNFISDLFYSIQKDKSKLRKLYTTVLTCVYKWNGSHNNKFINLRNDIEGYVVSTELDLEPNLSDFSEKSACISFERFTPYINLTVAKKNYPEYKAKISIDYDLYKILKSVENGYRPSAKDKNRFISFLTFINKLSEFSNYDEKVTIRHFDKDKNKEYVLNKDGFGYSFSEVK